MGKCWSAVGCCWDILTCSKAPIVYTDSHLPALPVGTYELVAKQYLADTHNESEPKPGFENFCHTVNLEDSWVYDIQREEDLVILLKIIRSYNDKHPRGHILVRIAAGKMNPTDDVENLSHLLDTPQYDQYAYSFSLTAGVEAHIIIRLVGDFFTRIQLSSSSKQQIIVGPNVQLGYLEQVIWDNYKLFLPTTPLIPYVTIGGLSANAGHGTGKDQPAIAGMIKSMDMLLMDGTKRTLVQGIDADFDTVHGAHLGAFGIITGFTIECEANNKFQQTKTPTNYQGLLGYINNNKLFSTDDYVSVIYFPTYRDDEFKSSCTHNVSIVSGKLVAPDTPNQNNKEFNRRVSEWALSAAISFVDLISLPWILSHHKDLIPAMQSVMAFTEVRLGGDVPEVQVGSFHELSHFVMSYPWALDDIDVIIPISDTDSNVVITKVLNYLADQLEAYRKQEKYVVIDAIYLRFIKGTTGGLSTSQLTPPNATAEKTTHYLCLDIVSNLNVPGYDDFKQTMEDFLITTMKGKPHWGKSVPDMNYGDIYGERMQEFKDVLLRYNNEQPIAQSALMNPFLAQITDTETLPIKAANHPGLKELTPEEIDQKTKELKENVDTHMKYFRLGRYNKQTRTALHATAAEDTALIGPGPVYPHPPKHHKAAKLQEAAKYNAARQRVHHAALTATAARGAAPAAGPLPVASSHAFVAGEGDFEALLLGLENQTKGI